MHNTLSIILVNPQMGENIGTAARAMLNFGISDLRIVNPRDGWPNDRAGATSSGALDKMPPVQVFDSLAEAVADCHHVMATTARDRDSFKSILTPEQAGKETSKRAEQGERTAILFGAERTGLTKEELGYAKSIITIPCNPEFSSFNLAQAVLLLCYECAKHDLSPKEKINERANQSDLNAMLDRLVDELDAHGFFRSEDLKPSVTQTIQGIFRRADLYDQEVRTMHGIITSLIGRKINSN